MKLLHTSCLTALALTSASTAFAQSTSTTPVDEIIVTGRYLSLNEVNAVKTPTPIINIPQSLSIIGSEDIQSQAFTNIGDLTRYTPGLTTSQGEGHRDAIIIRGQQTTADFFQDGIRDDVQYFRPLYNVEQVEILRGSNAPTLSSVNVISPVFAPIRWAACAASTPACPAPTTTTSKSICFT